MRLGGGGARLYKSMKELVFCMARRLISPAACNNGYCGCKWRNKDENWGKERRKRGHRLRQQWAQRIFLGLFFFLFESQVNRLKMKRQGKPKGVACVGGIGVYARANVCLCVCVYPRARLREYVGLSICASTRKKDGDRKS